MPAGAQESDDTPLVRSVTIRGVTKVERDALADGIYTKGSQCKNFLYVPICLLTRSPTFNTRRYLDPDELRRDELRIRLYYWRRGYRDVAVRTTVTPARGGVRVRFDIDENEPTLIERLTVQQRDSVLPSRVIASSLQLRAEQPLDLVALDSSMLRLRDALWERGYADARVQLDTSAVDNTINRGPVTVILEPGLRTTVRGVNVQGNSEVSDLTVRRLLRFKTGDLYRRSAMLESQRDLYLSGLFSEVEMGAQAGGDSAKTVQIRLTEAPLRNLELTGGFTTADYVQVEALFTRFNFMGGARRLTLRGTMSNLLARQLNNRGFFSDVTGGAQAEERDRFMRPTWAASVELHQPWFLAAGNQLGTSIFTHRRSVPGVVTDKGAGGSLAFTRDLGLNATGTVGYTYEASTVEASDVYFCVSFGVCVPQTIDVIAAQHPLSPLSLVTQYDGSNHPFTPTRGVRGRMDLEHA
jgi:outer membrane protein assembly factor BamA